MAGDARTKFSRTVVEQVTCPRCGVMYEYDRELTVERTIPPGAEAAAVLAAEAELERQQAESAVAVVRCPSCHKFAPGAHANRLLMVGSTLGGAAICALAAVGLLMVADATGRLFWVLALVAGLGVPAFLLMSIFALLSPTTHKTRLAGTRAAIEPAGSGA